MIIYSVISRMNNVLGEYSEKDGDFVEMGRKVVMKSQRSSEKCSVTKGDLRFVFFSEDEFSFLALSKIDVELEMVTGYLDRMSEAFYVESEEHQGLGVGADGVSQYKWVSLLLKAHMEHAKTNPSLYQDHKLMTVEQELEDVTAIASQNIDQLVSRGVHLDDLMHKTDSLKRKALNYNIKTKQLSRLFTNDKYKTYFFIAILLIIVITYCIYSRT